MNALFFPIALFLVVSLLTIAGATQIMVGNVFTVVLFVFLIVWIYVGVTTTCNLYYDNDFVYVEGPVFNTKVPLARVTKIAKDLTGMRATGVTSWRYRLEFAPSEKLDAQIFYEVDGGTTVKEFVVTARKVNPALLVEL